MTNVVKADGVYIISVEGEFTEQEKKLIAYAIKLQREQGRDIPDPLQKKEEERKKRIAEGTKFIPENDNRQYNLADMGYEVVSDGVDM